MENAYRDENSIPTLIGSSNVDGKTPVRVYADPVTHRLLVDGLGSTGPTGPGNFTGYTGYTGYTGATGYTGYTGPGNFTGYTGPTGAGSTGYTGYTGYTGGTGPVQATSLHITTATSSSTPTPDISGDRNAYTLTALAVGATFGAPSGSPTNGTSLWIRVKDNGTSQTLAWNSAYSLEGIALPNATTISKIMTMGFIYNTDNSLNKWQLVALAQEA